MTPASRRASRGAYSKLQFLRAISHSLVIHSAGFLAEVSDDDDNDGVNVDEQQQQQQQQQHIGPATWATAAADATSARSALWSLPPCPSFSSRAFSVVPPKRFSDAQNLIEYAHAKSDGSLASAVPSISLVATKFKVGHVTLTTPYLKIQQRTAAILQNWKMAVFGQQFDWLVRNLAQWHTLTLRNVSAVKINFILFKIQYGGPPLTWKIEKRLFLSNGLTDQQEIWHDDAH